MPNARFAGRCPRGGATITDFTPHPTTTSQRPGSAAATTASVSHRWPTHDHGNTGNHRQWAPREFVSPGARGATPERKWWQHRRRWWGWRRQWGKSRFDYAPAGHHVGGGRRCSRCPAGHGQAAQDTALSGGAGAVRPGHQRRYRGSGAVAGAVVGGEF